MKGMHGIIFSYEKQTDLRELIANRIHGSIPFAGDYRVIDFVLSAMVNAGITDVGVIMHGKCQSMLDHLGSYLQGHPDMKHIPGVDMSSGSLGQGISAAVGMALSAKLSNESYRVYTLLGDGEIQEGRYRLFSGCTHRAGCEAPARAGTGTTEGISMRSGFCDSDGRHH